MRLKIATVLLTAFLVEAKYVVPATEAPEENKNNDYSFSYGVKDMQTGDVKDQWESKQDGVVKGHYSVMEADGMLRTVEYVADKEHGFNAVVKYNSKSHHPLSSSHQQVQMETDAPAVHETAIENKYAVPNPKPTILSIYRPKPLKENPSVQAINFPIDLSFLESNTKVIPLTISKITPVEIKVDETTKEKRPEINNNRFSQPFLEKDFKPILAKINAHAQYNRDKNLLATPGLRNFASGQTTDLKTMLQQEVQESSSLYKPFLEKKPLNNIQMVKLRANALKRNPTIISVKYH